MVRILLVVATLFSGAEAARLRDVPLGECHGCEVTCFEDCSLKYDREILQDDNFLQISVKHENTTKNGSKERVAQWSSQYASCLREDKCPCEKEEAKAAAKAEKGKKVFLQKKNTTTTCAVGEVSCAQNCSRKVVNKVQENLQAKVATQPVKKQQLIQRAYPIHSVTVGVFAKGAMNLDECLKFCLAATCGCDKAPGLDSIDKLFNAIKANDAAQPGEKDFSHRVPGTAVADTHQSKKYRPAKIEECAKGMIGKKVSKGLYISFGGIGNELEICSKKFMEKIFGPGDHSKKQKLCQSTKSDDAKWGCIWNEEKKFCSVGFSPNLHCLKQYYNDPSRL